MRFIDPAPATDGAGEGSAGNARSKPPGPETSIRDVPAGGVPRIAPSPFLAALAAGTLFIAVYGVLFALSGIPIARALRGAFANGFPDAVLALAVFATARRLDGARPEFRRLLRLHFARGAVLVGLAFAAKSLFLWLDVTFLGTGEPFRLVAAIVGWQAFVSALVYAASAAAAHVWLVDRRLREEEARAARAEALRARAELAALRARLNPHFLFNVLHSVLGMVRGDPALAEAALEGLGDLLRYSLRVHRDGVDRTPLREEWEFMETYLALEKIRLGDRLRVTRRVEETALDLPVPTFSLQPLVENAVRHGIAPRAAGGSLRVEARVDGAALRIEVTNEADPGREAGAAAEAGTGLRVLRERLGALYEGRAELEAGPTGDGAYRVVLRLPVASIEPAGES